VDSLATFSYPRAPLSGVGQFTAGGSGTFDVPRYDVRFLVNELTAAKQPVGQVTGTLALRGKELSGQIDIASASNRLFVNGTGRISLAPQADSEITLRFHDSYLDPYVRVFVPRLSPYMTAVATGSVRIAGALADVDRLFVDGTVDKLEMKLFDPAARNADVIDVVNAAPLRLS